MITADQLLCHALGDYVLQSDYMAQRKRSSLVAATAHAVFYALPFLALRPSLLAWLVIVGTHALIDRYAVARYVVFAKNLIAPREARPRWVDCEATGYPADRPAWLAVWLFIIADNVLHVLVNGLALAYL